VSSDKRSREITKDSWFYEE